MADPASRPRGLRRLFGRGAAPAVEPAGPAPREPGFASPAPAAPDWTDLPEAEAAAAAMLPEDLADGAWPDPELAGGETGLAEAYADVQAPDDDYARDPAWDMAPGSLRDLSPEGMLGVFNLGKAYKGRKVVHDVSINVRRGEAVGLLGPNGAGKTTVFYMITGLVKPDKGMIQLDGHDVTGLPMTGARASASATCRRRPRSFAG